MVFASYHALGAQRREVIDGEDGVRARIVVKDIASGGGKAKSLGISSPPPSSESIKMALAIGGYSNAY